MPVNIGMSQNFNFYYYFHVTVTDGLLIEKPMLLRNYDYDYEKHLQRN